MILVRGITGHLHADDCPQVHRVKPRLRFTVIRDHVEEEVRDLLARGYRVVECKCLGRKRSSSPAPPDRGAND
jgi:hypothetical protein